MSNFIEDASCKMTTFKSLLVLLSKSKSVFSNEYRYFHLDFL